MKKKIEYKFLVSDSWLGPIIIDHFDELNIDFISYKNNLCPSHYTDARCVWNGDISINLKVNREKIKLNNNDKANDIKYLISVGKNNYLLQGLTYDVFNKSVDETYFYFTIELK